METPNLSYIEALAGEDHSFKDRLIQIIKAEFPEEYKDYVTALKSGDYVLTAALVHKLKNKISMLGLEKSYILATSYEAALKKGNLSKSVDFEKVLSKISNFLNEV